MKLSYDTSPEQDTAIADENLRRNPEKQPEAEIFATLLISEVFNRLVVLKKQQEVDAVQAKLQSVTAQLTGQDLLEVLAIAEKYASQ